MVRNPLLLLESFAMTDRIQALPTARTTGGGLFGGGATLPADVLEEASWRLGLVSLVYAITYSATFFPPDIVVLLGGNAPLPGSLERWVAGIAIISSIVIFVLTRTLRLNPQVLLDLGLIYLVISSLGIAFAEFWRVTLEGHLPMLERGMKPWFGISWVCLWIISFAVLVPNTPGKVLLTSLVAASMPPLVLLISMALDASPDIPGFFWGGLATAMYGSALIAFVGSRTIYGLGRDISEARVMGSYRLVERLGQGGMGEVWKAEHRMLARPAAIKLIRTDALGADAPRTDVRRRFEREAQATALLRSPHTVELYDFGVTEDGRFYYVMELLDGLDLETITARFGALPAQRVVAILRQACDSLSEAHDHGLVHRDIKPANVYLCRMGNTFDFVKVLDFGLVKYFDHTDDATRLTADGVAAGTPAYMAPEMAEGIADLDHRADLYALGCVGYWLLTGRLVFDSDSPVKMIVDHARTPPEPPSQRTETPIPAALDEIILWCLEKNPEKRPSSAAQLSERLATTGIGDDWNQQHAREWWNLHLTSTQETSA